MNPLNPLVRLPNGEGFPSPTYNPVGEVTVDLQAATPEHEPVTLRPGDSVLVPTGFALTLPEGHEAKIGPSALKGDSIRIDAPRALDRGHRGELSVKLFNQGDSPFTVNRGDPIAQLIIAPATLTNFKNQRLDINRILALLAHITSAPSTFLLPIIASLLMIFCFVFAVKSYDGLYADGANFLAHALMAKDFYSVWPWREFAINLNQFPLILAITLGVRSVDVLAALYTAGLVAIPMSCYATTTWLTRSNTLAAIANAFVICCVYFPTALFAVGEFHVLYALFWLSAVIILFRPRLGRVEVGVLLFAGLAMMYSYELSAITGVILAGVCLVRATRYRGDFPRAAWLGFAALFLLAMLPAIHGIQALKNEGNESQFSGQLQQTLRNGPLLRLVEIVIIAGAACLFRSRIITGMVATIAAVTAFSWWRHALYSPQTASLPALGAQYDQRAQVFPFLLAGFALLVIAHWPRLRPFAKRTSHQWVLAIPLCLVSSLYLAETRGWGSYMSSFCTELAKPNDAGDAAFFSKTQPYSWNWEDQTMSVLLRSRDSRRVMTDPSYHAWRPPVPDLAEFKRHGGLCPGG